MEEPAHPDAGHRRISNGLGPHQNCIAPSASRNGWSATAPLLFRGVSRPNTGARVPSTPFIPEGPPSDSLPLWVVFERPLDYPNGYVLRVQYALRGGQVQHSPKYRVAATLHEIREHLPDGLHMIPRQPGDDPAILEVWRSGSDPRAHRRLIRATLCPVHTRRP